MSILDVFKQFPKEAQIVGHLLAVYSTLEIDLMHCVQVPREDFDTVLKAMFRPRGETSRIDIADAFGRQVYRELELGTEFEMALSAMRNCLKIRNQYAHCVWWDDWSKKLAFANLEDIANSNEKQKGLRDLKPFHVDVPLLESQSNYFEYTDQLLSWVTWEGRVRDKKLEKHIFPKPAQLAPPDLYIP